MINLKFTDGEMSVGLTNKSIGNKNNREEVWTENVEFKSPITSAYTPSMTSNPLSASSHIRLPTL